jgi:hypothetical protein
LDQGNGIYGFGKADRVFRPEGKRAFLRETLPPMLNQTTRRNSRKLLRNSWINPSFRKKMGAYGRRRVEDELQWTKVGKNLVTAYETLLSGGNERLLPSPSQEEIRREQFLIACVLQSITPLPS